MKKVNNIILLILFSLVTSAQVIYNKNVIYCSDNGLVYSPDSIFNFGEINNNGNLYAESYYQNDDTTKGVGNYYIKGDIMDNGTITENNSIYLSGNVQKLSGNAQVTNFWNLYLEQSGPKYFLKKAAINNLLSLNDIELNLTDTLFVAASDTGIIRNEKIGGYYGLISGTSSARVLLNTISTNHYNVPLGSYTGGYIYRPVEIYPVNNDTNKYALMFFNHNPDDDNYLTDSLDNSLCYVDSLYYYKIQDVWQDTSFGIIFHYLPAADGTYNTAGYYLNGWNPCNFISQDQYNEFTRINVIHNNNGQPITLAYQHVDIDSINGNSFACAGNDVIFQVSNSDNYNIQWHVTGGNIIEENNNSVSVTFTGSTGNIFYTLTDQCQVKSDTVAVTVYPIPQGGFTVNNQNILDVPVTFTDTTQNASYWDWDFGNGYTSGSQISSAYYTEPGSYTVTLIVTDANGCKDTVTKDLSIEQIVKIPNIFTPNGDGVNDYFQIIEMGLKNYTIEVFNRWGSLIYKGGKGTVAWDGKTPAGDDCTTGTYFYVFEGEFTQGKKINKNGTIFLSR